MSKTAACGIYHPASNKYYDFKRTPYPWRFSINLIFVFHYITHLLSRTKQRLRCNGWSKLPPAWLASGTPFFGDNSQDGYRSLRQVLSPLLQPLFQSLSESVRTEVCVGVMIQQRSMQPNVLFLPCSPFQGPHQYTSQIRIHFWFQSKILSTGRSPRLETRHYSILMKWRRQTILTFSMHIFHRLVNQT